MSLNGCSSIAWRHEDEYSAGYVFTSSPVSLGERVVVQILATENMYIGSLAFGLTSCDPSTLDCDSLPEDSDMLLDRAEYWVVSKDVANTPDVGDELSFLVKHDGSVEFSKNGAVPSILMHVDVSVPLWGFWDVYGNTQRLRMVGGTMDPVVRPDQAREDSSASRENDRNNRSMTDLVEEIRPNSPLQPVVPPRYSNMSIYVTSLEHSFLQCLRYATVVFPSAGPMPSRPRMCCAALHVAHTCRMIPLVPCALSDSLYSMPCY